MTALLALAEEAGTLDEVIAANEHLWPMGFVVLAVVAAFVWAARRRASVVGQLGNAALLRRLLDTVNHPARLASQVLITVVVAFLAAGLLRVQYGGSAEVVPASGLDVVLVVDYSKSMLAEDVYPTRSERLEAELTRFLEDADRRGDRVGVVVFAGRPRGFPLTRDSRMLKLYLERADPKTENPGGTAIGRALSLALTFLVDARRPPEGMDPVEAGAEAVPLAENDQAIILLTDGEDTETRPLEVAAEAAKLGVKIYTVGIGSNSGEPIQSFDANGERSGFARVDGEYVMTRLDESLLEEIATSTGGRYVRVDPKAFGLDKVREMLEDLSRSQREDEIEIHRDEAFSFFLIPGLLLLCLSLGLPDRKRSA
ncbi:MAG: VWA domain-containing protein [Nannocystaceae bacterium]|nr:VWA domain-containing protein [Nannocystaceae bacterium]